MSNTERLIFEKYPKISTDYTRRGFSGREETYLPNWLGHIGMYLMTAEEGGMLVEKGHRIFGISLAEQLGDKMRVLSQSPRICTGYDMCTLKFLRKSMGKMWSGQLGRRSSDINDFCGRVDAWLDAGISANTIGGFFEAIGGIACLDPTLQRMFVSQESFISRLPPLAGMRLLRAHAEYDEAIKAAVMLQSESTLTRTAKFSTDVTERLERRIVEIDEEIARKRGGEVRRLERRRAEIQAIARSANYLAEFLEVVERGGFKESRLERPCPYVNIVVPVAAALTETLSNYEEDFQSLREDVARRLIRIFRRRRVGLWRDSILGFCASFRQEEQVDLDQLQALKADIYMGYGMECVGHLANCLGKDGTAVAAILQEISVNIIPEFIFQMRTNGYHTFEWEIDDYKALGLSDEVWILHEQRLKEERSRVVPGPEVVKEGDVVWNFTGHWGPKHVAHMEAEAEVAEDIDVAELIHAGLLPEGFDGNVWVGVTTNMRKKSGVDVEPELRHETAKEASGGTGSLFYYDLVGDLHTAQKLMRYWDDFRKNGQELALQGRVVGTGKLVDGSYNKEEEVGWQYLNTLPHIFLSEDYDSLPGIHDRIEAILENFEENGVMILLIPIPEVHASFFRDKLSMIDDETLATLVHPSQVQRIRKLYG